MHDVAYPTMLLLLAERTLDRDFFMSAEEARSWGIIDDIIHTRGKA